jgi:hypothetical protein
MNPPDENARRSPFVAEKDQSTAKRTVPILQLSSHNSGSSVGDPMDVTPPATAVMGPPARTSPEGETNGGHESTGAGPTEQSSNMAGPNAAAAAAAGAQQPKVVQTAFIHKLYKCVLLSFRIMLRRS